MKPEIIPTILVKTFEEVKERIKLVENYVDWVQLDIMDGVFVENLTWNNPEDLKDFKTKVKLEAHLMVKNPEKIIDSWLEVVDRIIVHYESSEKIQEIINKVHKNGKQIGVALNPETSIEVAKPFLNDLDLILLMSVQPGKGGQEFELEILEKIRNLRNIWPGGNIEVDGGVSDKNIKEIFNAGANLFCVGTYIYQSGDIKQVINKLKENYETI
ncbi:MAG TPA: ribulose-phosphate 3-epimerase [Candidatus Portnoybacteria bacterium]|nr:ribulose-phosphate 3-epimerase [Candidatus Portnoybacteria bacterium]